MTANQYEMMQLSVRNATERSWWSLASSCWSGLDVLRFQNGLGQHWAYRLCYRYQDNGTKPAAV